MPMGMGRVGRRVATMARDANYARDVIRSTNATFRNIGGTPSAMHRAIGMAPKIGMPRTGLTRRQNMYVASAVAGGGIATNVGRTRAGRGIDRTRGRPTGMFGY